jgi:hypothetical protein
MRFLVEYRFVLSLACGAITGVIGLHTWPFPAENVFLALIQARQPAIYAGFAYTYATVWFSTPFLVLSGGFSLLNIFVARWDRPTTSQPLPAYQAPETREELFVILGERHRQTSPQRASVPTWLTIPERGLYTGMVIVGAIGAGKTSACMYPYVEQLLRRPRRSLGSHPASSKAAWNRRTRPSGIRSPTRSTSCSIWGAPTALAWSGNSFASAATTRSMIGTTSTCCVHKTWRSGDQTTGVF